MCPYIIKLIYEKMSNTSFTLQHTLNIINSLTFISISLINMSARGYSYIKLDVLDLCGLAFYYTIVRSMYMYICGYIYVPYSSIGRLPSSHFTSVGSSFHIYSSCLVLLSRSRWCFLCQLWFCSFLMNDNTTIISCALFNFYLLTFLFITRSA